MRVRTNARAACILLTILCGPALAFQNEPDGFRGVRWGAPFVEHAAEMLLAGRLSEHEAIYLRSTDDNMSIGGVPLESLRYSFYRGQFYATYLRAEPGAANAADLVRTFDAQFGKGQQNNRFIEQFMWQGDKAVIFLSCARAGNQCIAILHSRRVAAIKQIDADRQAAEAKKDF